MNNLRDILQQIRESNGSFDSIDESFARIFLFFINELTINSDNPESRKIRRAFVKTIRRWTQKPVQLVSKKIIDHFIENHPKLNPFKVGFRPRNKYGIPVIFEHPIPIAMFATDIAKSKTVEEIRSVMENYVGMSIVTLDEDTCLNSSGFSRSRPQGWKFAYDSCGIEVMTEQEYEDYKKTKLNQQI
jgi:hypothetical protein